uniref:S1 motif domain-containing protein n=1 Tax=Caenorhabditis japonica TaxID=281687 RepID=A0A8R1I1U6_CAEJA
MLFTFGLDFRTDLILETNSSLDFAFGSIVQAIIVEIIERGVYVNLPGSSKRIFMSNNHLSLQPVRHPDALGLKLGDKISVHWFGRDEHTGNIRLSRKTLTSAKVPAVQNRK